LKVCKPHELHYLIEDRSLSNFRINAISINKIYSSIHEILFDELTKPHAAVGRVTK